MTMTEFWLRARSFAQRMSAALAMSAVALAAGALPAAATGQPVEWQLGMQEAVTPVMESINWFHNLLLVLITVIVLFVLALLIWVMVRFNEKANPTPSRTSHNTMIEVAWTVIPILILVVVAVPSFRLLFQQTTIPEPDVTVKAIGYQWYWGYEYPDAGIDEFSSIMLQDDERGPDDPRLLAVDYEVVVPVGKVVRVVATAADVIHNFAMPSFGVKVDAVPGRLTESWFRVDKEGIYYGQCSELCGVNHAFMPIAVRVVSQEQYDTWVAAAADDLDAANEQLARMIEADKALAEAEGDERLAAAIPTDTAAN